MRSKMAKHPGFKAVQQKIEGEGYSEEAAGAILADKTRGASAAAKKKNPRLNRVKGKRHAPRGKPSKPQPLTTDVSSLFKQR
jgi:hypothetical protein